MGSSSTNSSPNTRRNKPSGYIHDRPAASTASLPRHTPDLQIAYRIFGLGHCRPEDLVAADKALAADRATQRDLMRTLGLLTTTDGNEGGDEAASRKKWAQWYAMVDKAHKDYAAEIMRMAAVEAEEQERADTLATAERIFGAGITTADELLQRLEAMANDDAEIARLRRELSSGNNNNSNNEDDDDDEQQHELSFDAFDKLAERTYEAYKAEIERRDAEKALQKAKRDAYKGSTREEEDRKVWAEQARKKKEKEEQKVIAAEERRVAREKAKVAKAEERRVAVEKRKQARAEEALQRRARKKMKAAVKETAAAAAAARVDSSEGNQSKEDGYGLGNDTPTSTASISGVESDRGAPSPSTATSITEDIPSNPDLELAHRMWGPNIASVAELVGRIRALAQDKEARDRARQVMGITELNRGAWGEMTKRCFAAYKEDIERKSKQTSQAGSPQKIITSAAATANITLQGIPNNSNNDSANISIEQNPPSPPLRTLPDLEIAYRLFGPDVSTLDELRDKVRALSQNKDAAAVLRAELNIFNKEESIALVARCRDAYRREIVARAEKEKEKKDEQEKNKNNSSQGRLVRSDSISSAASVEIGRGSSSNSMMPNSSQSLSNSSIEMGRRDNSSSTSQLNTVDDAFTVDDDDHQPEEVSIHNSSEPSDDGPESDNNDEAEANEEDDNRIPDSHWLSLPDAHATLARMATRAADLRSCHDRLSAFYTMCITRGGRAPRVPAIERVLLDTCKAQIEKGAIWYVGSLQGVMTNVEPADSGTEWAWRRTLRGNEEICEIMDRIREFDARLLAMEEAWTAAERKTEAWGQLSNAERKKGKARAKFVREWVVLLERFTEVAAKEAESWVSLMELYEDEDSDEESADDGEASEGEESRAGSDEVTAVADD